MQQRRFQQGPPLRYPLLFKKGVKQVLQQGK